MNQLRAPIIKSLFSHGFTKSSTQTVYVLADLLDRYLKAVVGASAEFSSHGGRLSIAPHDVVLALEDVGTTLEDLRDYSNGEGKDAQRYSQVSQRKQLELAELRGMFRLLARTGAIC